MTTARALAASILCSLAIAPLGAQFVPDIPIRIQRHDLDSGYLHNPATAGRVVFRAVVRYDRANSLRLRLGTVSLPAGSTLRLTGALDGAEQVFDARAVTAWHSHSAVFNGGEVAVELVAAAGSRGNRVVVDLVEIGEPVAPSDPIDSLCGADDRVASSDPRQGRQYPTGCTAWLVNEFTVLTAGHCVTNPAQQIHFNVPSSSSTGALRYPPPADQYPYETSTLRSLNGGVGADWAVVRAARNSNSNRYPGQVQGQWYELGTVPPSTSGQQIRITGYGTNSAPADRRLNQAQTTHVDSLTQVASTYLRYITDTTGGNSGSPIIHENTGRAIGIHTHAGCSSGGNHGTRIDRGDLQAALQATMGSKVLGSVETIGVGCAGRAGVLTLSVAAGSEPVIGQTTVVTLANVPNATPTVLAYGFSDTSWNGTPLPWPIPFAAGCTVWTSVDVAVAGTSGSIGGSFFRIGLPSDPTLVGFGFFLQGYAFEAGASGGVDLRASNALGLTVGRDL